MSGVQKVALALVAGVLFAGGLYVGVQVAKPPPPPDLGALSEPVPGSETRSTDSSSSPVDTAVPSEGEPDSRSSGDVGEGGDKAPTDASPAGDVATLRQPPPGHDGAPRIALVIDDLGRSVGDVERLASLGIPITYSVLPFEVKTAEVVAELRRRGFEYLCHLPMQAKGDADPGPGALGPGMSSGELRAATTRALDSVPGAVGVNNHMGSAVMSDRRAASEVLELVADRNLYFVDSRTSADTLGYTLARGLGVPAAERQVFLDAARDRASIREQWAHLLVEARRRGAALAIAHPHDDTLAVLAEAVPAARDAGYEFVTASSLVER